MELVLEFGSGNAVTKSTGTNPFGLITFVGSLWYEKHFNIDEQEAPFNGKHLRIKLSPPIAGVGIRSVAERKKIQQEEPFGATKDPRDTAKQCLAYLNSYVQQDPDVFQFEIINNHLYINVKDRLG